MTPGDCDPVPCRVTSRLSRPRCGSFRGGADAGISRSGREPPDGDPLHPAESGLFRRPNRHRAVPGGTRGRYPPGQQVQQHMSGERRCSGVDDRGSGSVKDLENVKRNEIWDANIDLTDFNNVLFPVP